MLILVSNDDGVRSPGIKWLARQLKKLKGARVVVVAPEREMSAASHALTLHRPLRVQRVSKGIYAVDGTPADAVTLAVHTILKERPTILVSGINRGANLGEDVHYSGTVSAAMEGAIMGIPALAVSLVSPGPFRFQEAAKFAQRLTEKVVREGLPRGVVLNVNVPQAWQMGRDGYDFTSLGRHNYGGIIIEKQDPRGRPYYWIGGDPNRFERKSGTDCYAHVAGRVSITPIKVDMTDRSFLRKVKSWIV